MKRVSLVSVLLAAATFLIACDSSPDVGGQQAQSSANSAQPAAERGGSIKVGETTWTIVPTIQCAVFPGDVVNIAGHAASDPDLEIVIDYNGPTGVRIGGEGGISWYALQDTLAVKIDGKRVQGTATFNTEMSGTGQSATGIFEVNCG